MRALGFRAAVACAGGVLALPAPAHALDPQRRVTQYVYDHWQLQQGLPQGSVQSMHQSRDGYLWVGTLEGAARFDGVRFTVFDKGNTEGFKHNDVQVICEDAQGRLWFGTWSGLTVLEGGRFRYVPLPEGFRDSAVNALVEAKDGGLWVGTSKGLLHHDGRAFRGYTTADGLAAEAVTALLADPSGTLWIGTGAGLDRMDQGRIAHVKGTLATDGILSLYRDRRGALWVATGRLGLFTASPQAIERVPARGQLAGERVWATLEDRDGNVWLATAGQGVVRLRTGLGAQPHDGVSPPGPSAGIHSRREPPEAKVEPFGTREGLSLDTVISLFEDREGALWIGTDGTGLNRLRDARVTTVAAREGLPDEYVWTVLEDRAGRIWMGTNTAGLVQLDGGTPRQYLAPGPNTSRRINAMVEDGNGTLVVAASGQGLLRLDQGRLAPHPLAASLPAFVNALYADREGNLWVGGEQGGLFVVRGNELRAIGRREGLVDDEIRVITGDNEGNVWVGTDRGLSRIAAGRFGRITNFTAREGLPQETVFDVHVDGRGVAWIGTYGGGLVRLEKDKLTVYDKKAGLFDEVVYRILDDGRGRLWMSSNKGVFSASLQELDDFAAGRIQSIQSSAFGLSDGMRTVECSGWWQPAGWRARDGRLWFPTVRGLAVIDPARLRRNEVVPPVVVERMVVDAGELPLRDGLVLPAGRKRVEFHYTALSLLEPARVAFRYKLEPFDDDWVDAGGSRAAYYTNIPPGQYRFRVVAANNDGVWNEEGAGVAFEQKPRFTQTTWFYVLCAGGAVICGFFLHRVQVAGLHALRSRLEHEVNKRTELLEQKQAELEARNRQLDAVNTKLEHLAVEDGLTGLFNRRHLNETLDKEWARAARDKAQVALVLIDIDHFKKLNDTYGHPIGDERLRQVADVLRQSIHRPGDVAARYGGEEFALLLPNTMQAGAGLLADRVRRAVEAMNLPNSESAFQRVTLSCGVAAMWPRAGTRPAELVERADHALYRAKQEGRNRIEEAPPEPVPAARS
jgi:diguanylate cyclase (GGDEF)-like protein